ncbi:MAG: aldose epimerase family protein [Clostridia bacterium]
MDCIANIMRLENKDTALITLRNKNNIELKLMSYGASIVELHTPDREGKLENIVLTYEHIEDYIKNTPYFGVTVGRTSGRIGAGSFTLSGKQYELDRNAGINHIHGGPGGFSFKNWGYAILEKEDEASVEFTYVSKDMEEGYPGRLEAKVKYTLNENNELIIEYQALSDKNTICNLTNHSYFNLSGNYKRKVTEQYLKIKSDNFLETDNNLVPTGKRLDVANTPMDFNSEKLIGRDIESNYKPLRIANGYDHPWLLSGKEAQVEMYDEQSGRKMTISTTYPCVVVYTYNFANNERLKYDKAGSKYDGICFETQFEPDGINHESFNSAELSAGSGYNKKTVFKLEVL